MNESIEEAILSTSVKALRSLIILFLSVGFLGIGMLKLVNMPEIADYFEVWGFPKWSMLGIGFIEIAIAVGIFYVPTRMKASLASIILMSGAVCVHLIHKEWSYLIGPILIITAAIILLLIERKLKSAQL